MNCILPKYASAFTDRHGKTRIRLRRTGWQTVYVSAEPGTPEFTQEYRNWERGAKNQVGMDRIAAGSFDDLITRFYQSTDWASIKDSTRETYRGIFERFRAKYGKRSVSTMTPIHVEHLIAGMQDKPAAANNLLKRLRQLFRYANRIGMRADNPAAVIKPLKVKEGGFQTWQEEQIEQFQAAHPLGTMPRLAFDLALYTAQRKSDIRTMGPQHIERGKIRVKQLKTGKNLMIPIHADLARSIAATPSGHLAFIVNSKGTPFTYDSFGMWFMRQCRAAGLEGYSMHGLRKAASVRMAQLGLSNQMIKSITGHSSDSEVARYTRDAEQERMAESAFALMDLANGQNPALANQGGKSGKLGSE